jgi:autotransporter-associated beta strand protein
LQIGNGGSTGTISGNVNMVNANTASFVVNRSGSVTLPGAISGGGPVILNGTGDVFFTGANTYTGSTTVNAGSLHVGDGGSTGELGAGNVTVHGNLIFQRNNALTISSSIAGEGKVSQDGTGTVTYTGIASHLGGTFVDAGALLVNGSVSGTTTVSGGTLGGIGTLGIVNVTSGTLAPGASVGLLNTGDLAFSSGSSYAVEIDSLASYDAVNVTGTAALGNATLSLSGTYVAPAPGDLFFIVRNDGNDALSGTFLGLPEGGNVFAAGGQRYVISYAGNFDTLSATGGNDVVLTAIPEPGSMAMLLGGLGLLCARRRRES